MYPQFCFSLNFFLWPKENLIKDTERYAHAKLNFSTSSLIKVWAPGLLILQKSTFWSSLIGRHLVLILSDQTHVLGLLGEKGYQSLIYQWNRIGDWSSPSYEKLGFRTSLPFMPHTSSINFPSQCCSGELGGLSHKVNIFS